MIAQNLHTDHARDRDNPSFTSTLTSLSNTEIDRLGTPKPLDDNNAEGVSEQNKSYVQTLTRQQKIMKSFYGNKFSLVKKPELICNRVVIPAVILNRYSRNIEVQRTTPGYLELLKKVGYKPELAHGEITGWRVFECSLHGRKYYFPNTLCGVYNPYKQFNKIKASASRVLSKISQIKDMQFIMELDTTFPKEVSDLVYESREYEEYCWIAHKRFVRYLETLFGGQLGLRSNSHVWKTENPFKSHSHIHSIALGIKIVDGKVVSLGLVEEKIDGKSMKLIVTSDELKGMKQTWALIVNDTFKEFLDLNYEKLDISIKYTRVGSRKQWLKVLHKLKYNQRNPIIDIVEYIQKNGLPKEINEEWVRRLLNYKNRTRVYGFWNRLSTYVNFKETEKTSFCPICGSKMRLVKAHADLPEHFEVFYIGKKQTLYRIDRVSNIKDFGVKT